MKTLASVILFASALCFSLSGQTSNYPGSLDNNASLFTSADNVQTQLTVPMLSTDNVAVVASTSRFAAYMIVTICDAQNSAGVCTSWEDMLVTSVSGANVLVVTRGFAGTTAKAHVSGLNVSALVDAAHQQVFSSAVVAIETALGANLANIPGTPSGGNVPANKIANPLTQNTSGNAATATALAALPTPCSAGQAPTGILANGNSTGCQPVSVGPFVTVQAFTPQTPGGSLTGSSTNTITLTPCPAGVNGADSNHYLYISGGTGTAEAVLLTGGTCTSAASSGTVSFTPANSHSGAWTIQSATAGFQEAHNVAPNGSTVYFPAGSYNFQATATITKTLNMQGDGFISAIIGTGLNYCLFHSLASGDIWQQMEMLTLTAQTSGGCGISLDATGGGTNSSATVRGVNFVNLYDDILEVNAAAGRFENNQFQNFAHTAITIADPNCADCGGPVIRGNLCQNSGISGTADSCFLVLSTGGIVIQGNQANGDINEINFFVRLASTNSSGLIIDSNDIENFALYSIDLSGTYSRIAVTNNLVSNFSGDASTWVGILIADGAGAGISEVAISGNLVQGAGVSGNTCIELGTSGAGIIVGPNQINNCGNGIYAASQTGSVTVSEQQMTSVTTPLTLSSHVTALYSTPVTFASLPTVPNGTFLYCSDCTVASPCAGSGNGALAKRLNGAWVCN